MRPIIHTIATPGPGRLGTMAKPRGGDWLADEMAALSAAGVSVLVCALTAPELDETGLAGERAAATAAGLRFVAIPIRDRGVPDLEEVTPVLGGLARAYRDGAHIVTHCRFGIGRASLLAAAVLVLTGTEPPAAWRAIEAARGLPVPDTEEQRAWVTGLVARRVVA